MSDGRPDLLGLRCWTIQLAQYATRRSTMKIEELFRARQSPGREIARERNCKPVELALFSRLAVVASQNAMR